ncbi:hypothetical protein LCGC14_1905800 [marine sediment metagenome]|uniref:Uncharacterized protein n=1 Tax=marine sediment metagenome TaxID=412755 RepID=A0A0F9ITD0_9ZZZZ
MAEFRVGARGEGAVTALLDLVTRRRERREELDDDFRDFRKRAILAGVSRGSIDPITLERVGFGTEAFDRSTLGIGETATVPLPGGGRRTFKGPGVTKPPTEAEAKRLSLGAAPGQPFPEVAGPTFTTVVDPATGKPKIISTGVGGGLPTTAGGGELLQSLIEAGQTESPAARSLGERAFNLDEFGQPTVPATARAGPSGLNRFSQAVSPLRALSRLLPSTGGAAGASPPQRSPQDPSLIGESGSTEGAMVRSRDGSVWTVQSGQWQLVRR